MESRYILIGTAVAVVIIVVVILYFYVTSEPKVQRIKEPKFNLKDYPIIPIADIQFSEQNFPSVVYQDIFSGPNVWQGGYNLDQGRVITKTSQQKPKENRTPVSGYVKST
jgi:hypothetical protein